MSKKDHFLKLKEEIIFSVVNGKFYYAESDYIIFVCGAAVSQPDALRTQFLKYAESADKCFQFLLAEKALEKVASGQSFSFKNLAKFEDALAKISHCVVIFLESAGALAEVGYFSKSKALQKKTLLITSQNHQGDSFVNLGPVDLIERKSDFSSKLIFPEKPQKIDFDKVIEKISRLKSFSKYHRKFDVKKKNNLHPSVYMGLVLKILDLFRLLSLKDLREIFSSCFVFFSWEDLDIYIGILTHLNLIKIKEHMGDLILQNSSDNFFGMECREFDEGSFKMRAAEALQERNLDGILS